MSSWLDKIVPSLIRSSSGPNAKSTIPEGLWKKCPKCAAVLYRPELERNQDVCPKCEHHMRISARRRIDLFLDENGQMELASDVKPVDRLKFKDGKRYKDRLVGAQKGTGENDALVTVKGTVEGLPVVVAAFDFNFMGGSMGSVVGEKFAQAAKAALEEEIPFICFATSGGARMQEALFSLMQMAKTSAAIEKLHEAGVPYVSVMLDPCFGGVSASLALLGDVNIAEPNALIGFAGPRVIEQTVRETLPEGFQRSEFLMEKGAIDLILHRHEMSERIARLLRMLTHAKAA